MPKGKTKKVSEHRHTDFRLRGPGDVSFRQVGLRENPEFHKAVLVECYGWKLRNNNKKIPGKVIKKINQEIAKRFRESGRSEFIKARE